MTIKKLGKTFLIVGGAVGSVAAVVIAAPVLGPVGAIIIAGTAITEAVAVTGTVATAVGTALVAFSDID